MKRILILITATLALCCSAAAQLSKEEEDLMRAYGASDEYIEMQRKMQDILDKSEEAKQKEQNTKTIMLVLALAVAAVPLVVIGKKIIDHPEVRTVKGVASALGVALLGGAVLFGINYGWMLLRLKHGDALNFPFALIITLALAAGAIFLLNKKDKKDEKDS